MSEFNAEKQAYVERILIGNIRALEAISGQSWWREDGTLISRESLSVWGDTKSEVRERMSKEYDDLIRDAVWGRINPDTAMHCARKIAQFLNEQWGYNIVSESSKAREMLYGAWSVSGKNKTEYVQSEAHKAIDRLGLAKAANDRSALCDEVDGDRDIALAILLYDLDDPNDDELYHMTFGDEVPPVADYMDYIGRVWLLNAVGDAIDEIHEEMGDGEGDEDEDEDEDEDDGGDE